MVTVEYPTLLKSFEPLLLNPLFLILLNLINEQLLSLLLKLTLEQIISLSFGPHFLVALKWQDGHILKYYYNNKI